MDLIVRIDDFPGTKPDEFFKHNLENFKKFHHYFKLYNIPFVLGVIPGYVTPVDLWWLASQKDITVAMHGIVHNENSLDEFGDHPYLDIENALHTMKDRLEAFLGTRVCDYIPPHNTINADTLLALSRLGFERVYGGPETEEDMKKLCRKLGMDYVHSQKPLEYGRSDELMELGSSKHFLDQWKRNKSCDLCLTLHWTWEWNIGLENLDKYLRSLGAIFNDKK